MKIKFLCILTLFTICILTTPTTELPQRDAAPISSISQADCYLCGHNNKSLLTRHYTYPSIGLLNLNTFEIADLQINEFDDNGNIIKDDRGYILNRTVNFDNGIEARLVTNPDRRYSTIDIEGYGSKGFADASLIVNFLCQDCLDIALSIDTGRDNTGNEKPSSIALIDFSTKQLYSLASFRISYSINDYIVFNHHENDQSRIIVFYSPILE